MIRNIIFDMGNVLAQFDVARHCASRVSDEGECALLRREVFASVEWARLDRGLISIEDAVASINKRLKPDLQDHVKWLVEHWYDHFIPDIEMEKFIGGLKERGYKIYLLSNAGFDFYTFRPRLGALRYFDGELVSADVHLLKPDRQIFDALLRKFTIRAEESFFVDDMFSNVEAALYHGFSGMVYRGSIPDLSRALQEAGVVLA